jgi:hypothetical protein
MRLLVYSLLTAALVFVANAIDSSEDDGAAHARATSRTATNSVIDSTNRNLVLGTPTGGGKYPFLAIVQWNDVAIDPRVSDYLVRSSERPTIEEPCIRVLMWSCIVSSFNHPSTLSTEFKAHLLPRHNDCAGRHIDVVVLPTPYDSLLVIVTETWCSALQQTLSHMSSLLSTRPRVCNGGRWAPGQLDAISKHFHTGSR